MQQIANKEESKDNNLNNPEDLPPDLPSTNNSGSQNQNAADFKVDNNLMTSEESQLRMIMETAFQQIQTKLKVREQTPEFSSKSIETGPDQNTNFG